MTEASIATGFRTASEVFDHCRMLTSNRRSSDRRTALERGTFSKEAGRRRADRQATLMIRLTWAIMFVTATVVAMTFVLIVRGS